MSEIDLKGQLLNTPSKDKWKKVGFKKRAGILIPLFSLYSKDSLGIGDYGDLKLFIDWCAKTGNSIVQLLPMNEVGATFCPYDSLSSFALEPAYICLAAMPEAKDRAFCAEINALRKAFPAGKTYLDYRIKAAKSELLWKVFLREENKHSRDWLKFRQDNSYWIDDFALFKTIKHSQQARPWYEWEEKYRYRIEPALSAFAREHQTEIDFQVWLQWQLFKQFNRLKEYAHRKKVLLKGDLPILVSRDSAEVWAHPDFFKLEFAAGAPADMYCAKGQRWGVPTYNWDTIAQDGYRYIKEKLRYAENFYDILRIDHVVGLFRIWSILYNEPLENQGLNGFFDPYDEHKWEDHGRNLLSIILNSTTMLLCAEDLGVIPKLCPKVLQELGIPGNDVLRWTKDWKIAHDFLKPRDYRVFSVAMLSGHDTTNWPAWWENEAGTIDEQLFTRKCRQYGIDFNHIRPKLFDLTLSRRGRLRWRSEVNTVAAFSSLIGKRKDEVQEIIELYQNSYLEKEKLWQHLALGGPMQERSDLRTVEAALRMTLESSSVFCIQLLWDWLFLAGILEGDPYDYRINTPGTVSPKNWSLTLPISLERLLRHPLSGKIKSMIIKSGRR